MLDHNDTAVWWHVSIFPFAGHVRPHRSHHAAMTDDYDLVFGILPGYAVESRSDAPEHVFMTLAARRAPPPGALRIEAGIVGARLVRLSGEVAKTLLAELHLVFDRDTQFPGDDEAGLAGAREGARNHQRRLKLELDSERGFARLAAAKLRDFRFAGAGEAPNRVAFALAMTNHY